MKPWLLPLMVAGVLGMIAAAAPFPSFLTDKDIYEKLGRELIIAQCDDLQCFRVLVPWTLGLIPGGGYLKWRLYALLCETGAAILMGWWVVRLGASPRAALQVTWLTALGAGSLYTLYDPFTADPLMHLLGPLLLLLLFADRIGPAAIVGVAGIFGKEFAAVPFWVAGVTWLQQRDTGRATQALAVFAGVTGTWAVWQLATRSLGGYTPVQHSGDLLHGAFLMFWLTHISPWLAVVAVGGAYGALWLLWPAGVAWGSRELRQLTAATILPLLAFNYVQQPDRALWNFAFAVMPAVAVVLDRIPSALGWSLVVVQALVNLRFGAQLAFVPTARATLAVAMVLGLFILWRARTAPLVAAQRVVTP